MNNRIIYGHPGSGKTTRLSEIYAEVIAAGADVEEIAGIAFNVSVAYELAQRISFITGIPGGQLLKRWLSTFHAFCLRLLTTEIEVDVLPPRKAAREYLQFLKETQHYSEEGYELQILEMLIQLYELHKESNLNSDFWLYCLDCMRASIGERRKCSISDMRRVFQKTNFEITYELFSGMCREGNHLKLTFYGLLSETRKNIEKFKDRFKYILVDEVQDLSPIMWDILDKFHAVKILIGDPDQSIYGFRNVSPKFFLTLPYNKEIMQFTYRYDTEYAQMLELGISVLNKERQRKEVKGKKDSIKIHNYIPQRIESGAVLGRTNWVLARYSNKLTSDLVPHKFEEFSIYGNRTWKPLEKKFQNILPFLESSTEKEFVSNAKDLVGEEYKGLQFDKKLKILQGKYKDFYELFLSIKGKPPHERILLALRNKDLRDQAKELLRVHDLKQFIRDVKYPRVILSTVHRFKGREHDNIYIPDFNDGLFPMRKGDFEEEARICYVALSRVKKNLYLKGNSPFRQKFLARRQTWIIL